MKKLSKSHKILIAGGAGFLGSHLCDRLLAQGNEILCLDNFNTGSINNISHIYKNPLFNLVNHDIIHSMDFNVDKIFNLACPASPVHYQANPLYTIKTNILGSINLLDLARRYEASIFQASTSEVYGDPLVHPQKESYWGNVNSVGIRSCYDEGKRCAETIFFDYHRQHGINIKVARIFNTYGPRMQINDGRVVSNFIVQALKGDPLTLYGDGSQTRSFCYVDDLIEGIISLMNKDNDFHGPLNLGNPDEYSILELATKIKYLTGSSSQIILKPLPSDDPLKRKPDISLAKSQLNWNPIINLETGLLKTINYFEKLLSN